MTNRIDEIRKRRVAVKDPTYYDEDYLAGTYDILEEYAELYANAPADIDWLLGENTRLQAENLGLLGYAAELQDEIERLKGGAK